MLVDDDTRPPVSAKTGEHGPFAFGSKHRAAIEPVIYTPSRLEVVAEILNLLSQVDDDVSVTLGGHCLGTQGVCVMSIAAVTHTSTKSATTKRVISTVKRCSPFIAPPRTARRGKGGVLAGFVTKKKSPETNPFR
jgi:hypothetical protein